MAKKKAEKIEEKKTETIEEKVEEVKEETSKEKEAEEKKVPKKTKGEINKELKAEIQAENASRTDRTRAEKAARREAKAARKEANFVEKKKSKMSNGLLAILIFGVLIAMFAFVWGYNYFSKEASIESYLKNNGGKDTYGSIQLDENRTASITADGNDMTIAIAVKNKGNAVKEQTKYYKGEEGKSELEYIGAYFLNTIKPNVRGFSAKANCVVKVGKKKVADVEVKYKDVEDILEKYGMGDAEGATE